MAASDDQFKSFIGHLDNARNDTVQTMKILQTFWALAQNEGARLVSAEQRLNSCAAASEEMLGQTDALVNRLLENGLFELTSCSMDTHNDLATQYRKDITTEQRKLQTTLHESYARLQNLLAHQYAYEELLGNYRQYKTKLKLNLVEQVPFATKPGPKHQMIASPATPGLQLYIEGVQRDISHINLDKDTDQ
ncbi:hypothetical protein PROFUN_01950 [Planoprotostelium fungivorum]|uniref:Uncharacterized protein n=1 Tax=Planoprotostelium fungivorum TaxID=1890364 RepID=A0A2P6NAZ2_9EUKA|nr:hypothetical protein PROFUN_01950 [Planoprotostelium fungivorum]